MSIAAKTVYKTANWRDDNGALRQRGSVTVWFDQEMVWEAVPSGKRGRRQVYSDAALQSNLTLKVLFGMALRQTTGLVASLLKLAGLDRTVPGFSTPSRRKKDLGRGDPVPGFKGTIAPAHRQHRRQGGR